MQHVRLLLPTSKHKTQLQQCGISCTNQVALLLFDQVARAADVTV